MHPTNTRPRLIDGAPASLRIEKRARFAKYRIFFAAQNQLIFPGGGIAPCGCFNRDGKVFCQALDIALRNLNAVVDRTAIGWTFRAVEIRAFRVVSDGGTHDPLVMTLSDKLQFVVRVRYPSPCLEKAPATN